jgi:hypothetical protein
MDTGVSTSSSYSETQLTAWPLLQTIRSARCVQIVLAADFRYLQAPNETFGLAGVLWLAGIALLLCSAFVGLQVKDRANDLHLAP